MPKIQIQLNSANLVPNIQVQLNSANSVRNIYVQPNSANSILTNQNILKCATIFETINTTLSNFCHLKYAIILFLNHTSKSLEAFKLHNFFSLNNECKFISTMIRLPQHQRMLKCQTIVYIHYN